MAGERSCRTCKFLYYEEQWDNTVLSCVYDLEGGPENLPGVTPYSLGDRVCEHWELNPDIPKRYYKTNRYGWEQNG